MEIWWKILMGMTGTLGIVLAVLLWKKLTFKIMSLAGVNGSLMICLIFFFQEISPKELVLTGRIFGIISGLFWLFFFLAAPSLDSTETNSS